MRILYLADIRFPLERANGIQTMETCHALASRGHDVTLVVRQDTHQPPRNPFAFYGVPVLETLQVERVPMSGPSESRRVAYLTFAVWRSLGEGRDLIYTRDLGVASLLLRVPSGLRPPVVYEAHSISADAATAMPELIAGAPRPSGAKVRRLRRREERVWRGADGYVTITSGLARELAVRFGERARVAVVPDGVRLSATGESAALDCPFTIGYAGHLYPWKGVDVVIEALLALPTTRGLIVGGHELEPDLPRLRALADQLDVTARVTFTGMVPPPEVSQYLRSAHVLVLPNPASAISTQFTSPLKLFEYMAAGRPIVASDLPSIREVLTAERNAILVQPGNPSAFVAGIKRLMDDPALGQRLAQQALSDVRDHTWDRRAERLESLFAAVAGHS